MMHRRSFLRMASLGVAMPPAIGCVQRAADRLAGVPDPQAAEDESFWAEIRAGYELSPDYVNLENGYYCMMPRELLAAYQGYVQRINVEASHYMRTAAFDDEAAIVAELAGLAGCAPEQLVITRNTTEALDLVISGYPWQSGDEAVMAEQDYGAMLDMFEQQARRHGIVNRRVSLPLHPQTDDEIVQLYASAITERTKLLMVCHVVNITGQVLPVRKIADMAHARGVEVMVDGAHGFASVDTDIPGLGGDYYGTSLHKWLSAPLGCGLLWMRADKIAKPWPLLAEAPLPETDVRRFGHTGTHPVHVLLGIRDAIAYYRALGPTRKRARFEYLRRYWTEQVRDTPGVVLNTPVDPQRACMIANVGIAGMPPKQMAERLLAEHRIWTVAIDGAGVHGCRITPNVFTSTAELDLLVRGLQQLAVA